MYQRYYKLVNNGKSRKLEDMFKFNLVSRNQFIDCYKNKKIFVNDEIVGRNYKLREDDEIKLLIENEKNNYKSVKNDMEIIYEDEDILVVDKPIGITMNSDKEISLSNYITYIFEEKKINSKIRYFNRLDRDTSGIVIVFKNKYIQGVFENKYIKEKIQKEYTGIVEGKLAKEGIADKSIIREGIKSEVDLRGKASKTKYIPIKFNEKFSLVKFILYTGRTHQIRVHMESLGHSLLGDDLYGEKGKYESYFLYCSKYRIYSREKQEFIDIDCNMPKYFENVVSLLI